MFSFQEPAENWKYRLLILDDGQSFDPQSGLIGTGMNLWELLSINQRFLSLGDKFRACMDTVIRYRGDAVALFEDDDVYFPHYLKTHIKALEQGTFSAASKLLANDSVGFGKTHETNAVNRHHGAWAFTTELYRDSAGYPAGVSQAFDYILHGNLKKSSLYQHVDPLTIDPRPFYVYRWFTTGYQNGSAFGEDIYERTEQTHKADIYAGLLNAEFDAETAIYYRTLAGH